MYQQVYNPTGNVVLSTVLAALPIVVLLYCIALHPHRDATGTRHRGIAAPRAALAGVLSAFAISCFVFHMPVTAALSAFTLGALSGFVGVVWIVFAAMLLYTITVHSGRFEIVKASITHISSDRRLQCVLIAFCFGAILEGTSGFGTPVAIAGAIMVSLGFRPFQAAVLNLLANTAPVAWGAIGTPIVTLAQASGLDQLTLSTMAGRQLPLLSVLIPFWLVALFVKMEGGSWKQALEVWPATLCAGLSFAFMQWFASHIAALHLLTDIIAGGFALLCTVFFLRFVWSPKTPFLLAGERAPVQLPIASHYPWQQSLSAWLPWCVLIACCALWGMPAFKAYLNGALSHYTVSATLFGAPLHGTFSLLVWDMPALHQLVQRMPPVATAASAPEAARFTLNWLSAAGTGVFVAAVLAGLHLRLTPTQWRRAIGVTCARLATPVLVIAQVLGFSYLTRYAGTDAVLGLACTAAGVFYPFFAAILGWLGVFLTGSDTASNALFGNLQHLTAQQLHLNPVLTVATNSTGGVMGKMIDAQSIMVAGTACYEDPRERVHSVGPIFRTMFWHSLAGAALIGLIALCQAYVLPSMVPLLPIG